IVRNTDKCVLCGLCVRVCEEVKGITAFGLVGRGFNTYVSTAFDIPLNESGCDGCGECVKMCPTGALTFKETDKKTVPTPSWLWERS
nr:4Fe-4S binding protein [Clostridiales bacterium]